MNKIIITSLIVIIIASFVIAGCTNNPAQTTDTGQNQQTNNQGSTNQTTPPTNPTISYNAQISMQTYGGNINPQMSVRSLSVTGTTATLSILSSDNVLQNQTSMPIDNAVYTQLVDAMNANNFLQMADTYGGRNPDTGKMDITISQADISKTITIGTVGNAPPDGLNNIIGMLQSIEDNFAQPSQTNNTNNGNTTSNITTNNVSGITLMASSNNIIVDGNGMTVYTFSPDTNGVSTCYDTCATYWPPVFVNVDVPATGNVPGSIGMVQRTDGTYQATYDGNPIYYYIQDKNPGDMTGNNLNASGGIWYVINATA